jgi:hypothetical protein
MRFKADEIASVIQQEIERFASRIDVREVGSVIEVGDGIARIYGLSGVMAGEMLEFPGGVYGLAFNLEENSQWHGWGEKPSHTHHAFDNVRVALSPSTDIQKGYRVELNAQDRSATILYRNGRAVAQVPQDEDFPMRYTVGHSPYSPRKNRVAVMKQGATVRVLVNGQNVLEFEDPDPIEVSRVGLGGYRTRVNFSHVEVRRLGSERTEAPVQHAHK